MAQESEGEDSTPPAILRPPNARSAHGGKSKLLVALVVLATALALRCSKGYRSFPSIDDFAYIPIGLHWVDPRLYSGDYLLSHFQMHAPVWAAAVGIFEWTIGMSPGFWLTTYLLSIATVAAMWYLLRALQCGSAMLPLACLMAFGSHIKGIGRGLFDGALGDAFHAQWLALCLLLWCYGFLLRGRHVACGIALGLVALCHPVVGVHGAAAVGISVLAFGGGDRRQLFKIALLCVVVSAPTTIPILIDEVHRSAPDAIAIRDVIRDGILFRLPHEFSLIGVTAAAGSAMILLGALAISGLCIARCNGSIRNLRSLVGLLAAHVLFIALTIFCHGPFLDGAWRTASALPYVLHLSRTSPIFIVLASAACAAALKTVQTLPADVPVHRCHRIVFLAGLALFILVVVVWNVWTLSLAALFVVLSARAASRSRFPLPHAASALLAAAALHCVWHDVRDAHVTEDERQLYGWIRTGTPQDAVFIVPPGFEAFRYYSRRSVYVDFKLFPLRPLSLVPEWRRRLELVSQPDGRDALMGLKGPAAAPEWDRTYAQRNTPLRIVELLEQTQADYFLWDRTGWERPPRRWTDRPDSPKLSRAFENSRFIVYRLGGAL